LKSTFFLQRNCEDFVVSLKKLFPSRLQGEFLGYKFTQSGLRVEVKVASPTELNPYLSTFVGFLQRAGEKLSLSVHSSHRKYRIIGCEVAILPQKQVAERLQPIKAVGLAPTCRIQRAVNPQQESVSRIRRRQPKSSDEDCSSKGRVERSFKNLGSPLLPALVTRQILVLSARNHSPDDAA
jgi:hypothetical protein